MKNRLIIAIALTGLVLQGCNGDSSSSGEETTEISMNNFAGRWIFDQSETQSKVIDLSSDGNFVYEVRGATGGQGDVMRSTPGTYEVTPDGNIRSTGRAPGAPDWTGVRKGETIEFSLNGAPAIAFTSTGKPPQEAPTAE